MTFSERYGFAPRKALQIESMDEELRTSLWIKLEDIFSDLSHESHEYHSKNAQYREFLECIWTEFIKQPKSRLVTLNTYHIVHSRIQPLYEEFSWDKVYSFVEFVARLLTYLMPKKGAAFKEDCNFVLERESAAWRFVNDRIAPITEPREIQCIEDSIVGVGEETAHHLKNMLHHFSEKGKKHYEECENQAILAVEAYAREITGEKSKILSTICGEGKLPLHKSLQKSLSQLYAYANDEIRHAKKKGSEDSRFGDAKFMVLQCTSYINVMKTNNEGKTP